MKRLTILEERFEMAEHNLRCYSTDGEMTQPKVGCAKTWQACFEEVELLKEWIAEVKSEGGI